jgi:hypothetical protein
MPVDKIRDCRKCKQNGGLPLCQLVVMTKEEKAKVFCSKYYKYKPFWFWGKNASR